MRIITSIHIYNFHLFISYLGEGIRIIPFNDFRENFYKSQVQYPKEIGGSSTLQEITTIGHLLLGITDSNFSIFPLRSKDSLKDSYSDFWVGFKPIELSLDYGNRELFVLNDNIGIAKLNIGSPFHPKTISNFIPNAFDKLGDPVVSDMTGKDECVLVSIRGFGVSQLEYLDNDVVIEKTYRTEDAQDALYLKERNLIIIADSVSGVLLYKKNENVPYKTVILPNSDIPQHIESFYNNILIKGKKGIYIYSIYDSKLIIIWEGSVGAITTYYNYIVFSSGGNVHLIAPTDRLIESFKLRDESDIEIKKNKFLR